MTTPALVLVDIQQGFVETAYYGGHRNNPEAEKNAGRLLRIWRKKGWPVVHIHHHSTNPKSPLHFEKPGVKAHAEVVPTASEACFKKTVHSGFIENPLQRFLEEKKISKLVFSGITTNHCVSTNVRMANNLGFECLVVADATAAFDQKGPQGERIAAEMIHRVALASLQGEFAQLQTTEELLKQIDTGEIPMVNT